MLIIPDDRWYGESADIYTPRKVMDFKKWMILACCAFLYALPFVLSQWVWWGVFFCFVPLFYLGATMPLSFKDGFMWGLLIWVLHLHGVLYSIILMARGPVIARIFPAIFIVLYQALFVGTWFLVSTKIIQR